MASPDNGKNIQTQHDMAADGYMGDKDTLIENGTGVKKDSKVEMPETYGEVAPLHLDSPKEASKGPDGLKVIILSCVIFAIGVTVALIITIYCAPPQVAPHGAVACDDERCSALGVDVLKNGGSTVDAAITVAFCLSVVQPESSGIGGGGFMIYRDHKNKETKTYNFRETAPQVVDQSVLEAGESQSDSTVVGNFVGVPGYLRGLAAAHEAHGSKKWASLIQPSIDLARNGFKVSKVMAYKMGKYIDCDLPDTNPLVKTYCKEDKTTYQEGDDIKLEAYASLLEKIAEEGAEVFYTGNLAQELVDTVNNAGGAMTLDDIASYEAMEGESLTTTFRNMTVEVPDAPSGGPLLLLALNVLQNYSLKKDDLKSALYFHRFIEVMKFTNAINNYLGDPATNEAVKDHVAKIIDPDYAKSILGKINDSTTYDPDYYVKASGLFEGEGQRRRRSTHTTHLSVIGPKEDHVSLTVSLNANFGSKLMTPSGVILNNQLADFGGDKTSVNSFSPGARPLSHITPTIAHSRNKPCGLRLAMGAIGGWAITSETVSTIVNLLAFHMPVNESLEAPAIMYSFNNNGSFYAVRDFDTAILHDLNTKMGHSVIALPQELDYTVTNAVMKVNETVSGYSGTNRGGVATVF